MNKKRALVNLFKDIVLVTRVRIFYTVLFTNNNIKVVIQIDNFLVHQGKIMIYLKLKRLFCTLKLVLNADTHQSPPYYKELTMN